MLTVEESQCCMEMPQVKREMEDCGVSTCIIDHPGFRTGCLDPYVLRIANYAYIDQYGRHGLQQAQQHE